MRQEVKDEGQKVKGKKRQIVFDLFPFTLHLLPFLLVLSTVFVVSKDLTNGVVSGKYFWFYGSMGLVSITTVIAIICYKNSFRFSVLDLLVLLFTGSVFLSSFVWNDASQNTTKLTILVLFVVLYFCIRIVETWYAVSLRWLFCVFIILTSLLEAVWGFLQFYGFENSQHSLFKLTGSFFNPGPYAGYLAVVFPLALHYWVQGKGLKEKEKWKKKVFHLSPFTLSLLACIAILVVLPAAMSRASWLAVIAGSTIVLYKRYSEYFTSFQAKVPFRKLRGKFGTWMIGCIVIFLLTTAFAGMYLLKKDSADGRMLTWKVSLQTIVRHPFGVGLGNFSGAYGEEQVAYFTSGKATETEERVAGNPEYGFNEYLQIGIESGIVSLLLFASIIVFTFRSMIKTEDWGNMGSLTALLVFAFFSYPFSVLPFLIIFVFLIAINTNIRVNSPNSCHPCSIVLACSCLLVTSFCLYCQYPVYKAYKEWNSNRIYYHAGVHKESVQNYESLYPYLNDQIQFLFEFAQCLSKSEQPAKSNEVLRRALQISCDPMLYNIMGKNYQAMKKYEQAENTFVKSTQLVPCRLYPWYLLCKLYAEMELPEKAIKTAKIVLTKEPKVQSPAVNEMREEVKKLTINNDKLLED
jgi:tetratricopeptide (TPR) repeat protein